MTSWRFIKKKMGMERGYRYDFSTIHIWQYSDGVVLLGGAEMKIIESAFELIIIVLACILIILPEILYSLVLRGRDWIVDRVGATIKVLKKRNDFL